MKKQYIIIIFSILIQAHSWASDGSVFVDDYSNVQSAVDALAAQGGGILFFGPKTYYLNETVELSERIVFQGVMDAKTSQPMTCIQPSSSFIGDWLFTTIPTAASENADLIADVAFNDLNIVGNPNVGGINGVNIDVLRIERCRLAALKECVRVSIYTNLPRPYPATVAPGGLFINSSIFYAYEVCLNLEYSTQNRIFGNWFVSGSDVALKLKNSNKTWFFANEINQFNYAAVVLEDDNLGGNYVNNNFITMNWCYSYDANTYFIKVINGINMYNNKVTENILQGTAKIDEFNSANGKVNWVGNNLGRRDRESGVAFVPVGSTTVRVYHSLYKKPDFVEIAPETPHRTYGIKITGDSYFDVTINQSFSYDYRFRWRAIIDHE